MSQMTARMTPMTRNDPRNARTCTLGLAYRFVTCAMHLAEPEASVYATAPAQFPLPLVVVQ